VGRMARVRMTRAPAEGAAEFGFAGECIPFHDRRAVHRRRIVRQGGGWRVEDVVEGAQGAPLRSFLHLHPRFALQADGETVIARSATENVSIGVWGVDQVRLASGEEGPEQGWYSCRFGERTPAPVVVMEIDRNDGRGFGYELRPL